MKINLQVSKLYRIFVVSTNEKVMKTNEFTTEEWATIQKEYEKEAADVCANCGWEVDEWEIGLRETHPGDYLTPADTENYCTECLQALETEKESFDEWFNK